MSPERSDPKDPSGERSRPMSKVCDAADFFSPDYIAMVKELKAVPALHRKQWEFAMIYLALKKRGMLDAGKTGLSMGSGKEVVLYAIAGKVKHLTATDLYSSESQWDGAKAADPDEYIRMDKPIPVDDSKLSALHMDMRSLAFEDNTFDFAYSACAFEHIGTDTDFLRHLDEVYRVLKDGGTYVMTTEFTFASKTVPIKNNYLFSAEHLSRLLADSRFTPEQHFDARVTEQSANFPIPGRVDDLSYLGDHHFAETLVSAGVIPHVQVLYGKHPFTSCLFVLTKEAGARSNKGIVFDGLAESRAFLSACVKQYGAMIQADLDLNPFSFLRGGMSSWFAPHVLRAGQAGLEASNAIFHTDYYWFGSGVRTLHISMIPQNRDLDDTFFVEFRVHRIKTNDPAMMDCCYHNAVTFSAAQDVQQVMTIAIDDEYAYAVLTVPHQGSCLFSDIRVRVSAAPGAGAAAGQVTHAVSPRRMPFLRRVKAAGFLLAPEWVKPIYRRVKGLLVS